MASVQGLEVIQRDLIESGSCSPAMVASAGSHKDPIIDGQGWFTKEQLDYILAQIPGVLQQGQMSNGPWTAEFETAVARQARARYATAFPSGTTALEAALTALGIGPGDEVLVPVHSAIGNAMAVRLQNAKPVFCDISPETFCLEPEEIANKATPNTKAVILVHVAGLITPDVAEIQGRCQAKGLALIEDCAHAPGARWHRRPAGSLGSVAIFSFNSSRILTTGEGGAVVTSDRQLSRIVRSLQNRGRDMEATAEAYARLGHNNRFPEISALLGLAQYRSLPQMIAGRTQIASYYRTRLQKEAPMVKMQAAPTHVAHAYWKFIVTLPKHVSCDQVKQYLQRRGIPASLCDSPPLHRQPLLADLSETQAGACPVADDILDRHLCLPIDPRLTEAQRKRVIDIFLDALEQAKERAS